jgi:hypothetical protein
MSKDIHKKPTERETEAIAEAYRNAMARGDLEEIERLDAMMVRTAREKSATRAE